MALARPALTVDVNAAQQSLRKTGKAAAAHASAIGQAGPSSSGAAVGHSSDATERRNGGVGIQPGDIISEDDLMAQGGFSSDEEVHDGFDASNGSRRQRGGQGNGPGPARSHQQGDYSVDSQDFVDSDSSEGGQYGPDVEGELGSEEDDGQYDEDEEDELSSSPSIPDENIDFDLVYALHNFVATVEGQATVNKGNSLTLLDDSNSYWWLVRVLRSQEVGYIPAENIETPYERLARLNKHRNVDLTSATDDDHNQIPEGIITSHLIKQRSFGFRGVSSHSGKMSALSRRNQGPKPSNLSHENKRAVEFGPPTYLEHSGYAYSEDEDDDEHDMMDMEDDDEEEEEDELTEDGLTSQEVQGEEAQRGANVVRSRPSEQQGAMTADGMEPDDGMAWDGRESERIQRAHEERQAAKQAAEQRMSSSESRGQGQAPRASTEALQTGRPSRELQQGAAMSQQSATGVRQQAQQSNYQQPQQQLQTSALQGPQVQSQVQQPQQQSYVQDQGRASNGPLLGPQAAGPRPRTHLHGQSRAAERLSTSTTSSSGSAGFLPSQVQASRERASSDASVQSSQFGQTSPPSDAKKDKRASHRKSKSDEDTGEEKQGKKRSGVFSGLFSRKDRKERKSGHFSNSSLDADNSRTSEDSTSRGSLQIGNQASGAGRALQERDRAQQEAYQRQFLGENRADPSGRPARPGSLIGTPGSVPMLNVLRVFAGNDIESNATFKTVLLNQSTTAGDLVRQAIQRFRIGGHLSLRDYCLTVKLVEGDERMLEASERPLQVFDQLTEMLAASNQDVGGTIPSVKRSSVGSISSVMSNLSLNPAIARLESDFGDDHQVKFYLHRRNVGDTSFGDNSFLGLSPRNAPLSLQNENGTVGGLAPAGSMENTIDSIQQSPQNLRFALRMLIFPSDLPEGIVFDPQSNAIVSLKALQARGSIGQSLAEGVPQDYREKILALPRNATVAEVIERGLERFGILDGVVEGGDDVEDKSSRRRSKGRIRYGLCVKLKASEQALHPNSNILDVFASPPTLRNAPTSRRSKRSSTDSTILLNFANDLRPEDPVFVLRQVQRQRAGAGARTLSPTENVLLSKQQERRQAELGTVAPTPSSRALDEVRGGVNVAEMEQKGMSRQDIIAAQRAAARERRAAILGAQPNDENGVDVYLDDRSRLRSSKMLDTGKVRYSFIPVSGEEHDISAIVEDVLRGEIVDTDGFLAAPSRPSMRGARSGSATTVEDYVSAPASPLAQTPSTIHDTRQSPFGPPPSEDALERLVRSSDLKNPSVEERIDQVLSRLGKTSDQQQPPHPQKADGRHRHQALGGSIGSSRGTASPISGATHPSGTTTPTPLSMLAAGAAAAAGGTMAATAVGSQSGASAAPSTSYAKQVPLPPAAKTDFGIAHLYALSEAAARKKPPRKRRSKASLADATQQDDDFRPTVAGLFPPQAPFIEDRRIKDAYAPIGRHLNGLEDILDRLLADALRSF